jgi:hypothetical protein
MPHIVDSRIDTVKLYHLGATIYRTITVEAVDGELPEEIEVTGLPLSLHDATVRLSVDSPRGLLVTSQLRVGLYVAPRDELPEEPDQDAIDALEKEIDLLQTRKDQLAQESLLLSAVQVPPRPSGRSDAPPPASPMAARVALEAFVSDSVSERSAQIAEVDESLEKKHEQLEQLRDKQRRASSARRADANEITKTVVARLEARGEDAPKSARLTLSYFVPGARWAPQYQCRIERAGGEATIQLRALICQSSGEDWRGVKLELSTAAPTRWTELPKLDAIRIGKAQPPNNQTPGFRPPPQGAELLFKDHDTARTRAQVLTQVPASYSAGLLQEPGYESPATLLARSMWGGVAARPSAPTTGASYDDMADKVTASYHEELEEEADFDEEPILQSAAFDEMSVGDFGGAPPPPASYASQSYGAPGGPPPPMSAPAPAPMPKSAPRRRASAGPVPTSTGLKQKKMRGESSLITEDEYGPVSFMTLHLGGANEGSGKRGKLLERSRRERYLELFSRSGLTANFDMDTVLMQADEVGRRALTASLPAGTHAVRESAGRFDYIYTSDDRVDVPSDAVFHSVPLGERTARCELRYVTVPREAAHVFRVASIENPTREPLLRGPAEIYVGDEFVLTTTLPTVAPKERFRLGLGVEQAIKCARNTTFREERSGRAVVATAELHHGISIELVNNLTRTIECEVRERIPQPAPDAEVVIEELSVEPAWNVYEQDEQGKQNVIRGGRKWSLTIEPGQEVNLEANYVVKIYANNEVVGGNRRES